MHVSGGRGGTSIPSSAQPITETGAPGPDTEWPTCEPPHRINQIYIEPILRAHADGIEGVATFYETEVESFEQDEEGVTALLRGPDGARAVRCRYLVGCDGGRSGVRKAIGASLHGDAVVQRVQSTYIRAPRLIELMKTEPAWANFSINPRRSGNVYAIDGIENWLVHNYLRDEEADFESVDRDASIRAILGVGEDFAYEVLSNEDWFGRRLIADRFRDRRVFICGDAAHIWVPYAGYGMNAGVADAANLSWLLAATVNGWAPPAILAAYEAERLPITEQVSRFAMNHAVEMARERREAPAALEDETPEGEALRRSAGTRLWDLNVQQYCCAGLNFGYYYDHSPLIAYDGETQPAYTMGSFTPSTVPGCRVLYFELPGGVPLYDRLGRDYTLLRLDPDAEVGPLVEAAQGLGLPLAVLDVPPGAAPEPYRHALVLVRPDQHVAWRGDRLPDDAAGLVDHVRGAG